MRVASGTWQDASGQVLAAEYVKRTGLKFSTSYSAIGFFDVAGKPDSIAIFTDYNEYNIELHYIGRLTKKCIRYMFLYVFEQLKCSRVSIKILRKDKYIVKYLTRLGFSYEGTLKNYNGLTREYDALLYGMLKETVPDKWINWNVRSS